MMMLFLFGNIIYVNRTEYSFNDKDIHLAYFSQYISREIEIVLDIIGLTWISLSVDIKNTSFELEN